MLHLRNVVFLVAVIEVFRFPGAGADHVEFVPHEEIVNGLAVYDSAIEINLLYNYERGHSVKYCRIFGAVSMEDATQVLKSCEIIIGDLEFMPQVKGNISAPILEIVGCLKIVGTGITNVKLFETLEKIDCPPNEQNVVKNNLNLCVNENTMKRFKSIANMTDDTFQVLHTDCPICYNYDFDPKTCTTVAGDLIFNETSEYKELGKVKKIYGRLVVNGARYEWYNRIIDIINPTKKDKELQILSKWSPEYGMVVNNSKMPEEDWYTDVVIKTFGDDAMYLKDKAHRLGRGIYARLLSLVPNKKNIVADVEDEGECFQSTRPADKRYSSSDLVQCKRVIGEIKYISNAESDVYIKWEEFETAEKEIEITGGSDLALLFSRKVKLIYTHKDFKLVLKFESPLCWDADVLKKARTWFDPKEQYRLEVKSASDCTEIHGHINDYELRHENKSTLSEKKIKGYMILNETTLQNYYETDGDKDYEKWEKGMDRLIGLEEIHKPMSMYYNVPVVDIVMCAAKWPIPEFVKKVNITSQRDDDILLRVAGPAYKMNLKDYEYLKNHVGGEHRMDVDPLVPGECFFEGPVADLSQLNECEAVIGDLILDENTVGTTTTKLQQVTGCIQITNTKLDNLEFFDFYSYYTPRYCYQCHGPDGFAIKNNTDLCVYHKEFFASREQVNGNKPGCGSELEDYQIADRNFIFYDIEDQSELDGLNDIVELNGKIVVIATTAKNLTIFHKLERIHYRGVGPAIHVENNLDLEVFSLPSLKDVRQYDENGIAVLFKNNPKLNITININTYYKKVIRKATVKVQAGPEEEEYVVENTTFSDGFWIGVGASVGSVLGVVLLGIVIVAVVVLIRNRKSKSAKTNKRIKSAKPMVLSTDENNNSNNNDPMQQNGPMPDFSGMPNDDYEVVAPDADVDSVAPGAVELSVAGPATARTAMIGAKFYGAPKDNASVMMNERGASRGTRGELSNMGDATARTAYLGKGGWHGDLKENASRMRKADSKGGGPATARTAYIGKDWHGNLKDNVSHVRKVQSKGPVTAASAYIGNNAWDGNLRDNGSNLRRAVSKGAVTAKTVNIGKDGWHGNLKDNASHMRKVESKGSVEKLPEESKIKPITANTANIGKNAWKGSFEVPEKSPESKGKPEFELSVESKLNPATARTAYIGKKAWKGGEWKEPISKTHNSKSSEDSNMIAATARTANIGKKDWKGSKEMTAGNEGLKKTKSVNSVEMVGKKSMEKSKKSKDALKSKKKSKEVIDKKDANKGGK